MTLTDFLLARIAEDEVIAQAAHKYLVQHAKDFYDDAEDPGDWRRSWAGFGRSAWSDAPGYISTQIQRHHPARILAECDAKRRIVEEQHHDVNDGDCGTCVRGQWGYPTHGGALPEPWPCLTLRLLALPYADHPDWREEWRP